MDIREIKATDKIEECWALLNLHRDELTTHKHIMLLKPDVARYKALEDAGNLFTLALYDGETIVGYSVNIVSRNLHYSDLLYVHNDILFVHPDYRKGLHGVKLIARTEAYARALGAQLILFHGKQNTAFTEIMPRLGYGVQDIIFSKEL
jgi:GNAT superfamily N-acetyltransferase